MSGSVLSMTLGSINEFAMNRVVGDDKYINRCILRSHLVKFFVQKNSHPTCGPSLAFWIHSMLFDALRNNADAVYAMLLLDLLIERFSKQRAKAFYAMLMWVSELFHPYKVIAAVYAMLLLGLLIETDCTTPQATCQQRANAVYAMLVCTLLVMGPRIMKNTVASAVSNIFIAF